MDVAQLISTVGFPCMACIGMGYFCRELILKNNDAITQLTVAVSKLEVTLNSLKEDVEEAHK